MMCTLSAAGRRAGVVVGDQDDAHLWAIDTDLADALGDGAQGVDVEAGVGLVEDGDLRLEDRHLHDLVALSSRRR